MLGDAQQQQEDCHHWCLACDGLWWERHQTANGASHVIVPGNVTFAENATLGRPNACAF